MKKIFSATVILLFTSLLFVSCKKEYTCSCVYTYNGGGAGGDTTYTFTSTSEFKKKDDAQSWCDLNDVTIVFLGTTQTTACDLK